MSLILLHRAISHSVQNKTKADEEEKKQKKSFPISSPPVPLSGAEVMVAICDIFPQGTPSSTHPPLPPIYLQKKNFVLSE